MAVLLNDSPSAADQSPDAPIARSAWFGLATLFVVYLLNYLDRTLIYILFGPIKKEMALTDLQLALLGSTSFVIFYTVLGVPFGKLADRVVRKRMIAVGLGIWSIFSGLTGFMESFTGIFLCRMMVGVGEATLGPAALSLLSDLFPVRMRATVAAIFSAGIPVGAGIALLAGGLVEAAFGWRWAFYLMSFPGLLMVAAVLVLREAPRGATEKAAPATSARPAGDWRLLLRSKPLWFLYTGYALYAVAGNSLSVWMPTYIIRNMHMTPAEVGIYSGICASVGGLLGTVLGGRGADWFHARYKGGRLLFTCLGAVACIPLWAVMLTANSLWVLLPPYFILMGMALMWLGPASADVQDAVGPTMRGLGIAVYFFIVNVIAYGLGQPFIGKLSDMLGVAQDPSQMRYALLVSPISCLLAAFLLWRGSVAMRKAG